MVKKRTPYRIQLSCRPLDLQPGSEELAQANFGPTDVDWVQDDLMALLFQPQLSHNLYKGKKHESGNWIGMQSAIMDIPLPEPNEIRDCVIEHADRLGCDVCGFGVSSGMKWNSEERDKLRFIVPFDRVVDDPDERDVIKAHLMSKIGGVPSAAFNLATVYAQEHKHGFGYTFHHGPMKVEEVLASVPEPDTKIILPRTTEVETLKGEKLTFETLTPGTKFICPVCKDHVLPAPDGLNIVEGWNSEPGYSGYGCGWCLILKNNRIGLIEVEPLLTPVAEAKP